MVGAAAAQQPAAPEQVVVTGLRASVESAQQRRLDSPGIVDSLLSADILRLPDPGVGDAVQRITGVQVVRDRGEGTAFAVRGLVQVETTFNGREVFSAGAGRTLDLSTLPSDLLAGVDVHKTASADRLEGGLGGSIDLRTRRPLDLGAHTAMASLRRVHGSLVHRSGDQFSLTAGARMRTGDGAPLGWLINLVLQDRPWREDQKATGAPQPRTDLLPGRTVWAPGSSSETVSLGTRRRVGGSAQLQWRPAPAVELYGELHAAELRTRQDSHQVNASAGTGFVPGSVELFDGTDDLRRITWTSAPLTVLSFARDTLDRSLQAAAGAHIGAGAWAWQADLSHTRSRNELFFSGPILAGTAATFSHDLGGVPATALTGAGLQDPAAWRTTGLAYRLRPFAGTLSAARLDGERELDGGLFQRLQLGWRHADRRADNAPGLVFGDQALPASAGTGTATRLQAWPFADVLDGAAPGIDNVVVADLAGARDAAALRRAYGVDTPLPEAGSALGVWRIAERSDALYLRGDWRLPASGLQGEIGLRVVHTVSRLAGSRAVPGTGAVLPLDVDTHRTDWLPSATLRQPLAGGWQWRAALSRSIARPAFDQLSPSLSLLRNSVDPSLNQGSAGNPGLEPVRSHNLDLALEQLSDRHRGLTLTLFGKHVDGFVASASQPETYDGVTYQVSRPYNSDKARVWGLEAAASMFLHTLPEPWRGLGLQANYTFVDSATPDRRLGREVPLQNLSRHTLNLILLYEGGPVGARLAWNARSSFLSGVSSVVGLGAQPVTTHGHGWLDASIGWRLGAGLLLSLDAVNLTRTVRQAELGAPTRPSAAWANDRQLGLSLRGEL